MTVIILDLYSEAPNTFLMAFSLITNSFWLQGKPAAKKAKQGETDENVEEELDVEEMSEPEEMFEEEEEEEEEKEESDEVWNRKRKKNVLFL